MAAIAYADSFTGEPSCTGHQTRFESSTFPEMVLIPRGTICYKTMSLVGWAALLVCWFAWMYPFIFHAPHNQKRPSITLAAPTRAGLLLECLAIFIAFACRVP